MQKSLLEEKQKLKEKNEKLASQEKTKEKQLEEELEKEKQRIEKDYNRILRENENKEKIAQKKEIQEYKEHLHQKVNNEKKVQSFLSEIYLVVICECLQTKRNFDIKIES